MTINGSGSGNSSTRLVFMLGIIWISCCSGCDRDNVKHSTNAELEVRKLVRQIETMEIAEHLGAYTPVFTEAPDLLAGVLHFGLPAHRDYITVLLDDERALTAEINGQGNFLSGNTEKWTPQEEGLVRKLVNYANENEIFGLRQYRDSIGIDLTPNIILYRLLPDAKEAYRDYYSNWAAAGKDPRGDVCIRIDDDTYVVTQRR